MRLSPYTLPVGLSAAYISVSLWTLADYGISSYVPAFCLPLGFCYPALPVSLIVFATYMIFAVRRWGWMSPVYTAFVALMFDATQSVGSLYPSIAKTIPFDVMWLLVFVSFVWLLKPRFTPNFAILIYAFTVLALGRLELTVIMSPVQGMVTETALEGFFCFSMWRTMQPR